MWAPNHSNIPLISRHGQTHHWVHSPHHMSNWQGYPVESLQSMSHHHVQDHLSLHIPLKKKDTCKTRFNACADPERGPLRKSQVVKGLIRFLNKSGTDLLKCADDYKNVVRTPWHDSFLDPCMCKTRFNVQGYQPTSKHGCCKHVVWRHPWFKM